MGPISAPQRPRVQSQEGECVARAAPACQISAAVRSIANQHRLQVSLHHWMNERIHQHEEKLSAEQINGLSKGFLSPEEMQTELETGVVTVTVWLLKLLSVN